MKFTHGEHEINMDEGTGTFHFDIDGVAKTSTSLIGAKRIIDAARKKVFTPFNALVVGYGAPGYTPVKVVGKKAEIKRKYWVDAPMWITTRDPVSLVYPDTPENRAALEAAWTMKQEGDKAATALRNANDKAHKDALAAIPILRPGDAK